MSVLLGVSYCLGSTCHPPGFGAGTSGFREGGRKAQSLLLLGVGGGGKPRMAECSQAVTKAVPAGQAVCTHQQLQD